jgi:hypothetical protein
MDGLPGMKLTDNFEEELQSTTVTIEMLNLGSHATIVARDKAESWSRWDYSGTVS